MVCSKCQKILITTKLATPEVKRKSDMYYGSSARSTNNDSCKPSATIGNNGIGKNKLLSKAAKNPYAASSCRSCNKRVEKGRTYCQTCAYKANACLICGKSNSKATAAIPVIEGQKFNLK